MGIGVATEEITVVFFLAPTESCDRGERLVGVALLPSGTGIKMGLYALSPIGPPVILDLALTDRGVDAELIAVQGLKSVGGEVEITPSHGVLP